MVKMKEKISCVLIIHVFLWRDLTGINRDPSHFYCSDGSEKNIRDYCDGLFDCADKGDERGCENEALLIYGTSSSEQNSNTSGMNFIFLRNQGEFAILVDDSPHQSISAALSHNYDVYYVIDTRSANGSQSSSLWRGWRHHSGNSQFFIIIVEYNGQVRIRDIAVDYNIRPVNIYMIVDKFGVGSSRIQACDEASSCTFLSGDLMKRPIRLAMSPIHRLLFWIEQKNTSDFSIVKSLMDGTSASEILIHLPSPRYLTLDTEQERLYWLDGNQAHSATLDGTEKKMIVAFTEYVPSFGVHNDTLYWIHPKQKELFTCNRENCSHPVNKTILKGYPTAVIGLTKRVEENPNIYTRTVLCSDICLPTSKTNYSCACQSSDDIQQGGTLSVNSRFCEGTTLLAAKATTFYVIGDVYSVGPRKRMPQISWDVRQITALAYNSIDGTVLLASSGIQEIYSIYSLNPRNEETTLLLSESGRQEIRSLEYDDFGNNIYWIKPTDYTVKVTSLNTRFTTTLWQGNSSHIPCDIALAPNKGLMFLIFVINSTLVVERHAMDGSQNDTKILLGDCTTLGIISSDDMILHYMRTADILFVIKKNSINIWSIEKLTDRSVSSYKMNLYTHSSIDIVSLTSLGNEIIWMTGRRELCIFKSTINSTSCTDSWREITLGEGILKSVQKSTERKSPCHKANGGCSHLCLSSYHRYFTCACADNLTVIQSSMCQAIPANGFTETSPASTTLDDTTTEKEPITSTPHEANGFTETPQANTTFNDTTTEKEPITSTPHQTQSGNSSTSSHLVLGLFAILGCGLAAGLFYAYRTYTKKTFSPTSAVRYRTKSGTELLVK